MRSFVKFIMIALVSMIAFMSIGCSTVPAGSVGVKVYLLGNNKGVDNEVLNVGRYWIGINEQLYIYPTYQINYTYTKDIGEGDPSNEEFTFQTAEGMECQVDLGVSIRFQKDKIANMFQTYRKGPDEIRAIVVRNTIRNALNKQTGTMPIEFVYGAGKAAMIDSVQANVKSQLDSTGIVVEQISLIGSIRLPETIKAALNSKVAATQKAQQRENELREAEAAAKKLVATAQGEADANRIKTSSLNQQIIEWQRLTNEKAAIDKWNGQLPQVTGGATPMINIAR
jgi:regulator of protease activity HflC (stomatin/prohibitin superfamily)